MSRHGDGGFSIAQVLRARSSNVLNSVLPTPAGNAVPSETAAPAKLDGFRHFLCEADTVPPDKQFKVDGKDPLRDPRRLSELMQRLWIRMHEPPKWEGLAGSSSPEDNPHIPAGYTYLLQLIAHDLVQTNFPLSILGGQALGIENNRAYRLTLDTIYGGGPEVCPFAYAHDPALKPRSRLCLSGGNATPASPAMNPKGRDIGRSSGNFDPGATQQRLTEALVADPRNDDHAILAQLTAVFYHLHNGLVGALEKRFVGDSAKSSFARFLCARGAATLIYRNVIRRDVMKKLLHRDIYARYNVEAPPFLDRSSVQPRRGGGVAPQAAPLPDRGSFVPLEFTHGAFRFGHAMAREKYRINDVPSNEFPFQKTLRTNSLWRPQEMPLDRKWMVDWSFFFSLPARAVQRYQRSRRMSPYYAPPLNDTGLFPAIDDSNQHGVLYRDLMSASCAGLWSVDGLIEEIRKRSPDVVASSRLLDDRTYRMTCLREWLEQPSGIFSSADLDTLAKDPPLPFFILFEAATEQNGTRLGVLGSLIVAEVIFGALVGDQLPVEQGAHNVKESLSRLSQNLLQMDCFDDVPEIACMGQLIEYTATVARLANADPPFL